MDMVIARKLRLARYGGCPCNQILKGENIMDETKEAIERVYEKLCDDLKDRHIRWVNQNWALRGLELAKSQIQKVGDTDISYATAVLEGEHKRLQGINNDECARMYAMQSFIGYFIRVVEDETGIKLEYAPFTKAMEAMDNPRKLPPLPSALSF